MGGRSPLRVLVVVAMEAEARPIRMALAVDDPPTRLHPAFPATIAGDDAGRFHVATNGTDERFGVDAIASQPAVVTTLHAVERVAPDVVVSAGTAGGFEQRGGRIGQIVVSDRVVFHDRRIAIPGFDRYGVGDYPVVDAAEAARTLGASVGTVSSGNGLDAPEIDLELMAGTDTLAKDMEAAAVAWVCHQLSVPFLAVKAVTDLVDHPEETSAQFVRNLEMATEELAGFLPRLLSGLVLVP